MVELLRRPVAAVDDVGHVGSEHERRAVALEVAEHLRVAEELAKVDVEQVARGLDHDVVVVPVAHAWRHKTNRTNVRKPPSFHRSTLAGHFLTEFRQPEAID